MNLLCEDPVEAIVGGVFGWCGCGNPEAVAEYILQGLRNVKECRELVEQDKYDEAVKHKFAPDGPYTLLMYCFDKAGLIDHGGSVCACWLNEDGLKVLRKLEEWHES